MILRIDKIKLVQYSRTEPEHLATIAAAERFLLGTSLFLPDFGLFYHLLQEVQSVEVNCLWVFEVLFAEGAIIFHAVNIWFALANNFVHHKLFPVFHIYGFLLLHLKTSIRIGKTCTQNFIKLGANDGVLDSFFFKIGDKEPQTNHFLFWNFLNHAQAYQNIVDGGIGSEGIHAAKNFTTENLNPSGVFFDGVL